MTVTTHCMNNGTDTWIFTVQGDAATVEKVNCDGVIVKEKDITTVEQARGYWRLGFKLCPYLMRKGTVMPATCRITRKITTEAAYQAWADEEFDFINNDNDAERELAWREEFNECGFITV